MKRFLVLLLVFSFLVSACEPKTPAPANPEEEKVPEEELDGGDPEEEDVIEAVDSDLIRFHKPEALEAGPIIDSLSIPDGDHERFGFSNKEDYVANLKSLNKFWNSGEFKSGDYEGQDLIILNASCDGPCFAPFYRFAVNFETNTWTLLAPYSDDPASNYFVENILIPDQVDQDIVIPEFEAPEILGEHGNGYLRLLDNMASFDEEWIVSDNFTFTPAAGSFIVFNFDHTNCIYAVYPDGVEARYSFLPTMFEDPNPAKPQALDFTNTSNETVTKNYVLTAGGCGFGMSCLTRMDASSQEQALLTEVGTLEGKPVLMLSEIGTEPSYSDENQMLLRALYNVYNSYSYSESLKESNDVISIEEFAVSGNVFFYELSEGNYTIIYAEEFAVGAECGKPVIYLYPEERGIFNVKVGIDEMTVSIPHYGVNGWTVWATPKSKIFNPEDGKTYPYLFWEGYSDKQIQLDSGFTLARDEVGAQLPAILKDLGLNQKESADFMEFWLTRLSSTNTPYIEFNFVGTELFNQVAPLTITPAPDKVIRIYMVYQGVYAPGLPVPDFVTPEREGFTVVEWGGDLR